MKLQISLVEVVMGPWDIRFQQDNYLEKYVYPYLMYGNSGSDLWIIGKGGAGVTINAFYATYILNFAPFDCVLVPDVDGHVLENLGELLYTGRLSIFLKQLWPHFLISGHPLKMPTSSSIWFRT